MYVHVLVIFPTCGGNGLSHLSPCTLQQLTHPIQRRQGFVTIPQYPHTCTCG